MYFRTAADLGSFNAAARALHCSQPAVSDQVRRLERELGVALFARDGRGLSLTSAGRVFLGHAERVTGAAEDAMASVGRRQAARDRVVTVGTFRNAPYYAIADLAARFHAAHPDTRLRLPGQNSADVATAVRAGELEAGLVVLPVDDRGLEVRPLFRDEVMLVSADPARTDVPMTMERLAERTLILYDASHGFNDPTRRQLAALAQDAGVALNPQFEVEHIETALQLVARGLCDTMASRAVTLSDQFPAGLHRVGFARPFYDSVAMVTRHGAGVSSGTQQLLDLVGDWADGVVSGLAR
jgi:DNA-binding transcriptional LysR family regulator